MIYINLFNNGHTKGSKNTNLTLIIRNVFSCKLNLQFNCLLIKLKNILYWYSHKKKRGRVLITDKGTVKEKRISSFQEKKCIIVFRIDKNKKWPKAGMAYLFTCACRKFT